MEPSDETHRLNLGIGNATLYILSHTADNDYEYILK